MKLKAKEPDMDRPRRTTVQQFKNKFIYFNWKEFKFLGYRFGKKIGEGTNGYVMEAEFKGESLVCKYMRDDLLSAKTRKFLQREIEICKIISHKFIIQTHSIVRELKHCYIFMERAETDLLNYIDKNGVLELPVTRTWFSQLVDAIKYLHSENIAHRDLKLENIFISYDHTIKLGDFGYSCFVTKKKRKDFEYIKSKTFCGSKAYVAPEILNGIPYNPFKADIWSLGVVLSCMINGVMPFDPEIDNLCEKMMKREMNVREHFMKLVPEDGIQLLNSCCDPNIETRYSIRQVSESPWIEHF